MIDLIRSIRDRYEACITRSCRENKCGLQLDRISANALTIIHGTRYQRDIGFTGKLCDRIIFCGLHGFILAAVELKGGNRIKLSDAITQIQNGLSLASDVLEGHAVGDWLPLLVYSGHMGASEVRLLRTKSVEFRGNQKKVVRTDCNTELRAVLGI